MKQTLVLMCIALLLVGCASHKSIPARVPSSYLNIAPLPAVPADTASNLDFIRYVFALHDSALQCRQQIIWIKELSDNGSK